MNIDLSARIALALAFGGGFFLSAVVGYEITSRYVRATLSKWYETRYQDRKAKLVQKFNEIVEEQSWYLKAKEQELQRVMDRELQASKERIRHGELADQRAVYEALARETRVNNRAKYEQVIKNLEAEVEELKATLNDPDRTIISQPTSTEDLLKELGA